MMIVVINRQAGTVNTIEPKQAVYIPALAQAFALGNSKARKETAEGTLYEYEFGVIYLFP